MLGVDGGEVSLPGLVPGQGEGLLGVVGESLLEFTAGHGKGLYAQPFACAECPGDSGETGD